MPYSVFSRTRRTAFAAVLTALAVGSLVLAQPREGVSYLTHMTGGEEAPSRATPARGQALFFLSPDGTELDYTLMATNIDNVTASHIHIGAAGTNGGVVAFLAGNFPPGGGRHSGILAKGTITAENLTGTLAGQPLSALVDELEDGNAYVNVHTNDGVAPTNTGPGDFPGGEIRGQIRPVGN